jgi:hypothetical protein
MSNREFMQWACFHSISPIDDERCFDLPAAMIRQTIFGAHAGKDQSVPPLSDFLPFAQKPTAQTDVDAALIAWAKANEAKA